MKKQAEYRKHSLRRSRPRVAGQEGYLLVAVMLLITLMLIAMTVEAPRIVRDRLV